MKRKNVKGKFGVLEIKIKIIEIVNIWVNIKVYFCFLKFFKIFMIVESKDGNIV